MHQHESHVDQLAIQPASGACMKQGRSWMHLAWGESHFGRTCRRSLPSTLVWAPPFPRTRRVHVGVADLSRSITRSASGARLTFAVPHVRVAYGSCNGNSQACCCCYGVWRWYVRAWARSMHAHQPHMPWDRCCVKILVRPSEHPCRPRKPAALYMTIVRIHPSTHTCRCTTAHPHACKLFRFLTC